MTLWQARLLRSNVGGEAVRKAANAMRTVADKIRGVQEIVRRTVVAGRESNLAA